MALKTKTPTWYRKKLVERAKRLTKERDKFRCVMCHKDGRQYQLHGSHVFPEGKFPGMSDMLDNLKTLCAQCHMIRWHESPVQGVDWFKNKYPKRYALLKKLSLQTIKRNWKKEYEDLRSRGEL